MGVLERSILCQGRSDCPLRGQVVADSAPLKQRIELLEQQREQLLEACRVLDLQIQELRRQLTSP